MGYLVRSYSKLAETCLRFNSGLLSFDRVLLKMSGGRSKSCKSSVSVCGLGDIFRASCIGRANIWPVEYLILATSKLRSPTYLALILSRRHVEVTQQRRLNSTTSF
jgi:hypothetical protein